MRSLILRVKDLKGGFNQIKEDLLDLSQQPNYLLVFTKTSQLNTDIGENNIFYSKIANLYIHFKNADSFNSDIFFQSSPLLHLFARIRRTMSASKCTRRNTSGLAQDFVNPTQQPAYPQPSSEQSTVYNVQNEQRGADLNSVLHRLFLAICIQLMYLCKIVQSLGKPSSKYTLMF